MPGFQREGSIFGEERPVEYGKNRRQYEKEYQEHEEKCSCERFPLCFPQHAFPSLHLLLPAAGARDEKKRARDDEGEDGEGCGALPVDADMDFPVDFSLERGIGRISAKHEDD